jgi:hypothetical protein
MVRVEGVQRIQGDDESGVTGVVTLRNISRSAQTVNVRVTWIGVDGAPLDKDASTLQPVSLATGEMRELVLQGGRGSRDLRVSLLPTAP